jgi:hypothetical protein
MEEKASKAPSVFFWSRSLKGLHFGIGSSEYSVNPWPKLNNNNNWLALRGGFGHPRPIGVVLSLFMECLAFFIYLFIYIFFVF